jgi:iron complex transport system substrate-binding protein
MLRYNFGRYLLTLGLMVILLFGLSHAAEAQEQIKIVKDGKDLSFDVAPRIIDGRTMVPYRNLAESVHQVAWNSISKTVTVTQGISIIKLTIGSKVAYINDERINLDVAPVIVNGHTLVPVRFVAEGLGFWVTWRNNTRTVAVESQKEIKHALDVTKLTKKPKKIIVFDYATLDSLDTMGIEVMALPKSHIPAYLSKYKDSKYIDVGTLFQPNFEKIYELKPDVIFISARQARLYSEFKKIAPTIYLAIDGNNYMGSFSNNLTILGTIFDKEALVEEELAKINNSIKTINKKVGESGQNALVILVNEGTLSAFGQDSRFGIIHKEFGFPPVDRNIRVATHGQSVSFEYVVEQNPDYIFVVDRAAVTGGTVSAKKVLDNALIRMTKAYKNDRIIYLNSEVWYVSSGGLGGTLTMVQDIQKAISK